MQYILSIQVKWVFLTRFCYDIVLQLHECICDSIVHEYNLKCNVSIQDELNMASCSDIILAIACWLYCLMNFKARLAAALFAMR